MDKPEQIIFVHIPKTAGSSLKTSISQIFESHDIFFDYSKPLSKSRLLREAECIGASIFSRNPHRVIYGHFLAGKYADLGWQFRRRENCTYITFLRDPLQRAVSHYHFWRRVEDSEHRVWRKMIEENWSLEEFLLSKEHQNFFSQFLWRFPISNFDFVGVAEYFDQSVEMLGHIVPKLRGLTVTASNANPGKEMNDRYRVDPELAKMFARRNAKDYSLYRSVVEKFLKQREQFEKGEAAWAKAS